MIPTSKIRTAFVFWFTTILFVATKFVLFQGFNGTDDLHYAMLAAKLLNGQYNPFEKNDIFSGRILLISFQALIYRVGGISVLTSSLGTIIASITTCWLLIYKLLPQKSPASALIACCLFYFNPALTESIKGILPDAYVMLSGVVVFLLIKRQYPDSQNVRKIIINNILAGSVIASTLLIKETILVFLPFAVLIQLISNGKKGVYASLCLVAAFLFMVAIFGFCYQYFARDALIKLVQIKNSAYPNPCNFDHLPFKDLLVRLTYGVYIEFIVNGFYPVVLGCVVLIATLFSRGRISADKHFSLLSFASILLISIYFPFSLKGYQPLCSSYRHFLFLAPFAIQPVINFFNTEKSVNWLVSLLLLMIAALCFANTGNKWELLIYCLLFACFSLTLLPGHFIPKLQPALLSVILFGSIFETRIFYNSHWFEDMRQLSNKLNASYYYFPDHDNMMHWKLLHQFNDNSINYFSIEKDPFPIFKLYDQVPDQNVFHPGWLIVNNRYSIVPQEVLRRIDSLAQDNSRQIAVGNVQAIFVRNQEQLSAIKRIIKE